MYACSMHSLTRRTLHMSVVSLASAALLAGCLSSSHVIPRKDLQRLAASDPQARAQQVRVIQSFQGEDQPPPAPRADTGGHVSVGIYQPVYVSGSRAAAKNTAKSKADDARVWLILAAAVAVGAAVTEGARYDGWVELHPNHPVHLYGWDGSYTWVPLSAVTPEQAAWARKAIVRPSEGSWRTLGRAPLNRKGWTYSLLMGSAEVPELESSNKRGFTSHIQFGRFASKQLGFLLDISLGWADDQFGDTMYDSRTSFEVQFIPVSLSKLHAGVFGQVGVGYRLDDSLKGQDREGLLAGGGGMLQLELTTRLALTARAGVTAVYGEQTSDFTVGMSIY